VSLPVAILAGGLATRLGALTAARPKSLLEVAGRPFIAHQLELLRRQGIERVVLCVGHMGEKIEAAVGNGDAFGLEVRYSFDGPDLLGTGGALKRARQFLGDAFFVMYGDSYLDLDYAAVEETFQRAGKSGLMTVCRNDDQWDRSNVLYSDGVIKQYDKRQRSPAMRHIDYGLGAIRSSALDLLPPGRSDLADLYRTLLARDDLAAYEVPTRFYEIGSEEGLRETDRMLAARSP
jgi:NDP-sugar pyrophosphorylase family protein